MTSKNERALELLRKEPWATSLVKVVDDAGGPRTAPPGLLFEARFAYEMRLACPTSAIHYEFDAGLGGSTVDFRLEHDGVAWLIELVNLEESDPIRSVRQRSRSEGRGIIAESIDLRTDGSPRETPLAELLHVGERIEDKVWDKRLAKPRKFPAPSPSAVHMIVVNLAGFEGTGDPDGGHCREVALGSALVEPEWRSDPDKPINGLFDVANGRPAPRILRERVHALAFVAERPGTDDDDEIRRTTYFVGNPSLDGKALLRKFPVIVYPRNPLYRTR